MKECELIKGGHTFGLFAVKGLCQKDIAVLGQFCASLLALNLYTQCSCRDKEKISNKFRRGALPIIMFW